MLIMKEAFLKLVISTSIWLTSIYLFAFILLSSQLLVFLLYLDSSLCTGHKNIRYLIE